MELNLKAQLVKEEASIFSGKLKIALIVIREFLAMDLKNTFALLRDELLEERQSMG